MEAEMDVIAGRDVLLNSQQTVQNTRQKLSQVIFAYKINVAVV